MIKYFLDEMRRESDELLDELLIECDLMEFKNEDEIITWSENLSEYYGDVLTMNDLIYLIDYALDQLEDDWDGYEDLW